MQCCFFAAKWLCERSAVLTSHIHCLSRLMLNLVVHEVTTECYRGFSKGACEVGNQTKKITGRVERTVLNRIRCTLHYAVYDTACKFRICVLVLAETAFGKLHLRPSTTHRLFTSRMHMCQLACTCEGRTGV